jgi:hypothetical protein
MVWQAAMDQASMFARRHSPGGGGAGGSRILAAGSGDGTHHPSRGRDLGEAANHHTSRPAIWSSCPGLGADPWPRSWTCCGQAHVPDKYALARGDVCHVQNTRCQSPRTCLAFVILAFGIASAILAVEIGCVQSSRALIVSLAGPSKSIRYSGEKPLFQPINNPTALSAAAPRARR